MKLLVVVHAHKNLGEKFPIVNTEEKNGKAGSSFIWESHTLSFDRSGVESYWPDKDMETRKLKY